MKKAIFAALALTIAVCGGIAASGCADEKPTYYNKTITLTGAALPINWKYKDAYDDGDLSKAYTYKELIEKRYSEIDFNHEIVVNPLNPAYNEKPWAEAAQGFSGAQDVVDYVDAHVLSAVYNQYAGMKLNFGAEDSKTVTVIYGGAANTFPYVETVAELAQYQSRMPDMVYEYLTNDISGTSRPGHACWALQDNDEDGEIDGFTSYSLTWYLINGESMTISIQDARYVKPQGEYDGYLNVNDVFHPIREYWDFWSYEGFENGNSTGFHSIITLPLHPEITITDLVK